MHITRHIWYILLRVICVDTSVRLDFFCILVAAGDPCDPSDGPSPWVTLTAVLVTNLPFPDNECTDNSFEGNWMCIIISVILQSEQCLARAYHHRVLLQQKGGTEGMSGSARHDGPWSTQPARNKKLITVQLFLCRRRIPFNRHKGFAQSIVDLFDTCFRSKF